MFGGGERTKTGGRVIFDPLGGGVYPTKGGGLNIRKGVREGGERKPSLLGGPKEKKGPVFHPRGVLPGGRLASLLGRVLGERGGGTVKKGEKEGLVEPISCRLGHSSKGGSGGERELKMGSKEKSTVKGGKGKKDQTISSNLPGKLKGQESLCPVKEGRTPLRM